MLERTESEVESGGIVTMSKSKNNGVDPQALVDEFGADTARLFTMFAAPPEQTLEWSDEGVQGAYRFIKRLWKAVHEHVLAGRDRPLDKGSLSEAQRALQAPGSPHPGQGHRRHRPPAHLQHRHRRGHGAAERAGQVPASDAAGSQRPARGARDRRACAYRPSFRMSRMRCGARSATPTALIDEPWPQVDAGALEQSSIEIVVQVNGKLRGRITVPARPTTVARARSRPARSARAEVRRRRAVRKVIVVRGKLVNVVV